MTRKMLYNRRLDKLFKIVCVVVCFLSCLYYVIHRYGVAESGAVVQTEFDPKATEQNTSTQKNDVILVNISKTIQYDDSEQLQLNVNKHQLDVFKVTPFAKQQIEFSSEDIFIIDEDIDTFILLFDENVSKTRLEITRTDLNTGKQTIKKLDVTFDYEKND